MRDKSDNIVSSYDTFYRERDPLHVYPVEFVVRAFLGNYPRHKTSPSSYAGKRVLDLGFGDGRNIPLLRNLGMEVSGVEISQDICDLAKVRMARLGIDVTLSVGRNHRIPFESGSLDIVLACHACYYINPGTRFSDNTSEIAQVLKPGGLYIFSAPIGTSYIMAGARDTGDGHMEIANDPYGMRNGAVLKKFDTQADIEDALSGSFEAFTIGTCRNDFWGIEEHVWTVICRKIA